MTESPEFTTDRVRAHYAKLAADFDRQANKVCRRAYQDLARAALGAAQRVLEFGAGCSDVLEALDAPLKIACDLSQPMIAARAPGAQAVWAVADAQRMPFADASFEAVCSINVLEHVPDPAAALAESARVLAPGGRCLAVTPNGDFAGLLDVLERLRVKLPEGPHRFLTMRGLAAAAPPGLTVVEHRPWLAFPAGPRGFVKAVDACCNKPLRFGLFQYILLEKRIR